MRVATLLMAVAGCAAAGGSAQQELERELAGRTAGVPQACLRPPLRSAPVALNRRTLVLRSHDAVWVNRLAADCPALTPMATLIVETATGEYCRNDRVSGIEAGSSSPGPRCRLGPWTAYRDSR